METTLVILLSIALVEATILVVFPSARCLIGRHQPDDALNDTIKPENQFLFTFSFPTRRTDVQLCRRCHLLFGKVTRTAAPVSPVSFVFKEEVEHGSG